MKPDINLGTVKRVDKKGNLLKIKIEKDIEINEEHLKMQLKVIDRQLAALQAGKERILEIAKKAEIKID